MWPWSFEHCQRIDWRLASPPRSGCTQAESDTRLECAVDTFDTKQERKHLDLFWKKKQRYFSNLNNRKKWRQFYKFKTDISKSTSTSRNSTLKNT
jgi:hypothetical protein